MSKSRKEYLRRWRAKHPGKGAEYTARWKYGIEPEEYARLFAEQGGVCRLCGKSESTRDRMGNTRTRLSVDHDHATGKIRGLLCHHCNAAIGHAKEDPNLLLRMARYVEGREP